MDRYIETIPKETMKSLMQWDWPGNVRELENLMERSVILSEENALRVPLSELRAQSKSRTGTTTSIQPRDSTSFECCTKREEFYLDRTARLEDSALRERACSPRCNDWASSGRIIPIVNARNALF